MIQHVVIQHLHDGMDRACFGIVGAVDQAFQPCVDYCAGTHGAWLDCRKQIALFQTVVSNRRTGVTQRHHLGVSRWTPRLRLPELPPLQVRVAPCGALLP